MGGRLWYWFGRWAERKGLGLVAESCLRIAAGAGGNGNADALFALGQSLNAREQFEEAAVALRRALAIAPGHARAWCALGVSYRQLADMLAARDAYERAIEISPDYPDAWVNLGEWHLVAGDATAALDCFDRVLGRNPRHYEALTNRTAALIETGCHQEAEDVALEALSFYPQSVPLHVNLGNVYVAMAKGREAANTYRKALDLDPESEEAALSLAALLGSHELLARAIEFIKKQIALKGESPDRLCRLAMAQTGQKAYSDARATCERVLEKHPDHVAALVTLSNALGASGDADEAMAVTRRILGLRPDLSSIHSNLLFGATYSETLSRQEVFDLHTQWAERHERPLLESPVCSRNPTAEASISAESRRLRIGYVSGDFVAHPVGFLIRDVMREHDKRRFDIWCYSQVTFPDQLTEQIKSCADHWEDSFFLSDRELAERIAADGIDILVDLSGHTARNRLRVFAMRAAPVQVTWLGYFHSTGLTSIDYLITDPYSTPLDGGQLFSERPVCLPYSRFCFSPPAYAPAVTDPPFEKGGHVTFGSFNRLSKMTSGVVAAWSAILEAVPDSRLLLKTSGLHDPDTREWVHAQFARHGIGPERLELRETSEHPEMLRQYGDMDIALDSFPFNGGMTTLEALWMGVPVVARVGDTMVSRQSTVMLTNIGLADDLLFADTDAYVAGAVALAGDKDRLRTLRHELRLRLSRSAICQADSFTHDLEFLYQRMWEAWQAGAKLEPAAVPAPEVSRKIVLHVGCGGADRRAMPGHFQGRGWREIRFDINPDVLPDVVGTMLDMSSIANASVDAVYSSHNLEHLHPHEVPMALREFRRVLRQDGIVVLTCPDLQSICALVAADKLDDTAYVSPAGPIAPLDMLYGHRRSMEMGNAYMAHNTGFTATTLERAFLECGFGKCVVRRGGSFDLWAIAYPVVPSEERLASDVSSCIPG